jgi:hypothetical protein
VSYSANVQCYFTAIQGFLKSTMTPETFCDDFISMWTQDRNEQYATAQSWSEPFDTLLLQAKERGETSSEEFSKRWTELWGYTAEVPYVEMLDRIHSSCYAYDPCPELAWEIDVGKLKEEVMQALSAYNALVESK